MDVTDHNIGPLMDEFWMLPMITSVRESVKMFTNGEPGGWAVGIIHSEK